MPSKVRVVLEEGRNVWRGKDAVTRLQSVAANYGETLPLKAPEDPQWRWVQQSYNYLQRRQMSVFSALRIYREPRRVQDRKSRYRRLLQARGLRKPQRRVPLGAVEMISIIPQRIVLRRYTETGEPV